MAPKAEENYDAEATKRTEIPNDQVMEDAGKVHLGKFVNGGPNSIRLIRKNMYSSSRIAFLF